MKGKRGRIYGLVRSALNHDQYGIVQKKKHHAALCNRKGLARKRWWTVVTIRGVKRQS